MRTIPITLALLTFISCRTKEYGCSDDDSCVLSSLENNFNPQDELYCTASVGTCNIYCYSPHSCESLVIYSSAESTNIICNATSSCRNTTIRIGDTSTYPLLFKSKHFTNMNPTKSIINCTASNSCAEMVLYFDGISEDQITLSSNNINAFDHGYFGCDIDTVNPHNNSPNRVCDLHCTNIYTNECSNAILDCGFADNSQCICTGDGCDSNIQNVDISYDNSTLSTTIVTTEDDTNIPTPTATTIKESFWESILFKYIIIGAVVLIISCGCCLIICCWKFEAIYDCLAGNTSEKGTNYPIKGMHVAAPSNSEFLTINHAKKDSQTVSGSHSGGAANANITDEDQRTSTYTTPNQIEMISANHQSQVSHENMPSTWYKYKQNNQISPPSDVSSVMSPSVISDLSPEMKPIKVMKPTRIELVKSYSERETIQQIQNSSTNQENVAMNGQYKKPTKQNKKRKKSSRGNVQMDKNKHSKKKEYKKVKIKSSQNKEESESESDPSSESESSSTEGDSDTVSDSSSGETVTDSDSNSSTKDGDNAVETRQTVNGVNIDDMMVNMVMLIQKTPNASANEANEPVSFPNTTKTVV